MLDPKKIINDLVQTIETQGGSDLHISENRKPVIRVNGDLMPVNNHEVIDRETIEGIFKLMLSEEYQKEFAEVNEIDFSYAHDDDTRFRGNGFVQQGKLGMVLRLIPSVIKTVEELNLPPILETFANKKQGFFLVVGPVGQGKTTTLAALIELINQSRQEHIITIEDPIEYVYEPKKSIVDQRELGLDTKSFYNALVGALRQDVDVMLVGEMRDKETMSAAVTAAETGHLVFSTLHTNNASQTIDRIIDSFPANQQSQIRMQLSNSLIGIFSQRLIPRISGGMIPAYELLINNNASSNLIREKRTHEIDTVIETGTESGMISMNRSLADLVRKGEITPENAYLNSFRPDILEKMIN